MKNITNVTESQIEFLTDELIIDLLGTVTKSTVIAVEYIVDESKSRTISGKKAIQKRVKIMTDLKHKLILYTTILTLVVIIFVQSIDVLKSGLPVTELMIVASSIIFDISEKFLPFTSQDISHFPFVSIL